MKASLTVIKAKDFCPGGVEDDLVDASPEEILRSEKIAPFDVAVSAVYLAKFSNDLLVDQIVIDRLGLSGMTTKL